MKSLGLNELTLVGNFNMKTPSYMKDGVYIKIAPEGLVRVKLHVKGPLRR